MFSPKVPSFGRAGRPKKIHFSDLFLWDPMIELELTGISISEAMGGINPEILSLFRDIGRRRQISAKRAREVIPKAFEVMRVPLPEEYQKALSEEGHSTSLGSWRSYIYSKSIKSGGNWPPTVSVLGQHFIEIEQALKEPTLAWKNGDMGKCADLLERSPALSAYLWPIVLTKLRNASSEGEITAARAMVMLELYLSLTAAWDAKAQIAGYVQASLFRHLFPDLNEDRVVPPVALFFEWLTEFSGVVNLAEYIEPSTKPRGEVHDIDSARRQLRHWVSGKAFPSQDSLETLFRNLYGLKSSRQDDPKNRDWSLSWLMITGTRRINFLMPILMPLRKYREPSFPFGFRSVQEWIENRYPYWYGYWVSTLREGY